MGIELFIGQRGTGNEGMWLFELTNHESPHVFVRDVSLKKEIQVPFGAPLFLGKWYGVATYFLYKKIRKKKYND